MKSAVKFVGLGMVGALTLAAVAAYSAESEAEASDNQLSTIIVTAPLKLSCICFQFVSHLHKKASVSQAGYRRG